MNTRLNANNMTKTTYLENHSPNPESFDEVKISDIIIFAIANWKFIASGFIIGCIISFCTIPFIKTLYATKFPIIVDFDSLPAITDPKKISSTFQQALLNNDVGSSFFNTLKDHAPNIREAFEKNNYDWKNHTFVNNLTESTKIKDGGVLYLTQGIRDYTFILNFELPFKTLDQKALPQILTSLNTFVTTYNAYISNLQGTLNNIKLTNAESSFNIIKQKYEEAYINRSITSAQSKTEIFKIEHELRKIASTSPSKIRDLLTPLSNIQKTNSTMFVSEQNEDKTDLNRVLRLKSALLEEKLITQDFSEQIDRKIAQLQIAASRAEEVFAPIQSSAQVTITNLNNAKQASVLPFDKENLFLPSFKLDGQPKDLTYVIESPKGMMRKMYLMGITLMGGFLGLLIAAAYHYFKKNKEYFLTIKEGVKNIS